MKSITEKNYDALSRIKNGGDNRKPIFHELIHHSFFSLKYLGYTSNAPIVQKDQNCQRLLLFCDYFTVFSVCARNCR